MQQVQVKLNKSNENPFYGLRACLKIFQSVTGTITIDMLDQAWNEVKNDQQKKEMLFSLLFSVGDITGRQHNAFKGVKRDSGGNANRESFFTIINWLKDKHYQQFKSFLWKGLFNEYTCFDLLFRSRVVTKGVKVIKVYDMLKDEVYRKDLANYLYSIVNGTNDFNKLLVAKFLTIPRMTKRTGHKKMLPDTKTVMEHKATLLLELSKLCGWEYETKASYTNFVGYRKWRQKFNKDLESVLFSTKRVLDMDGTEFMSWLNKLPAGARFRVKNRVLYSKNADETPKYPKLQKWYQEWEKSKEEKQKEQRVLEEKIRQGQASEEDKVRLEKVKKEAKVTIGATNFKEIYEGIKYNRVDTLKIEQFIGKVNLPFNNLVIVDDSGSMRGAPFNFATFIASVCLVKNPDDDGRNLVGMFDDYARLYSFIDKSTEDTPNSILRTRVGKIQSKPLVDPKLSFVENFNQISKFLKANFRSGGTNIGSIAKNFDEITKANPEVLDALKNYPVWIIISDGEWNNLSSPEASLNDFFRRCESFLGFKPFIIAIDINDGWMGKVKAEQFSGIDNFIYIPDNPAMIEQMLINFKDMDVFDVYTPLQSIYRSNRYDLVREATLK